MAKKNRRIPNDGIITIGVSFNYFDPEQKALLDHVDKRTNASAFVKRLIQRDVDGVVVSNHFQPKTSEETSTFTVDRSLMKKLI